MSTPEEKKKKLVSVVLPIITHWEGNLNILSQETALAEAIADAIITQHKEECQNCDKA